MKRQSWAAGALRPLLTVVLAVLLLVSSTGPAGAAAPEPPDGWPLRGAATVLRPFDPPAVPWGRGHRGVDLAAEAGDLVLATGAGRVSYAGMLAGRGVVVVDHGSYRTTYEPVAATVAVGTRVRAGDTVGRLRGGHCGTRSCLHWGLRRGRDYLDPLRAATRQVPTSSVQVWLLPASARAVAQRRAAARTAARLAARAAELALRLPGASVVSSGTSAAGGKHGFLRPVAGSITSPFGRRLHPVLRVWKLHDGTDFGAPCGSPIRAPHAGVVTQVSTSSAYGRRLFLDHGTVGGRRVRTSYNHATRYVVGRGSRVNRGQVIGYVGSTGYATGCHLHLMVWLDGRLSNPMSWL